MLEVNTINNYNMGYLVIGYMYIPGVGCSITSWLATVYIGVLYKEGGEPKV